MWVGSHFMSSKSIWREAWFLQIHFAPRYIWYDDCVRNTYVTPQRHLVSLQMKHLKEDSAYFYLLVCLFVGWLIVCYVEEASLDWLLCWRGLTMFHSALPFIAQNHPDRCSLNHVRRSAWVQTEGSQHQILSRATQNLSDNIRLTCSGTQWLKCMSNTLEVKNCFKNHVRKVQRRQWLSHPAQPAVTSLCYRTTAYSHSYDDNM